MVAHDPLVPCRAAFGFAGVALEPCLRKFTKRGVCLAWIDPSSPVAVDALLGLVRFGSLLRREGPAVFPTIRVTKADVVDDPTVALATPGFDTDRDLSR